MQQCINGGGTTPESAIELSRILGAAALEYVVAERVSRFSIEYTILFEYTESICIQYFRPFVAVISRCIASGEDVAELWRSHRTAHSREDAYRLDGFNLKFHRVVHRLFDGMPCHVKVSESQLAHA